MRLHILMLSTICGLVVACGSSSKDKSSSNEKVDDYGLVGGNTSANEFGLVGEGDIIFKNSLGSVESGKRFELEFDLKKEGNGLTVVTYAGKGLKDGIELEFTREGDELEVELLSTNKRVDVCDHFSKVDVTKTIALAIEVHNDESPAHILIEDLAADETLFDSEGEHDHEHDGEHEEEGEGEHDEGELVDGNGNGSFWGLRLLGADVTVSKAKAVTPEAGH